MPNFCLALQNSLKSNLNLKVAADVISTITTTHRVRSTGIILSGSPYSVYDKDSPHVDPAVFEAGVPVLGICYGLQVSSYRSQNILINKLMNENRK